MNILLVGGTCSLMNNIILKLRKEGHRVFLLTGDKYKHSKYEKVFERYDFPYDSENLNEIIESVNPDVTILLGAFDTNYLWNGDGSFYFAYGEYSGGLFGGEPRQTDLSVFG